MGPRVVVVGGGIAGLSVAFELERRGVDVTVLEAAARAGGHIHSERHSGYLCEWGPNGFLDGARATLDICSRLGLGSRVIRAMPGARRRFLVRDGKLRKLSSALSPRGWLRALAGRLVPMRPREPDESVFDFALRKLGREAATVLVEAAVTGVWAGDARKLSMRSAFPQLRRPRGTLASFPDGLGELPAAFAASLGARLRLGSRVTSVEPGDAGGFRVAVAGVPPIDAESVVLACPAWSAAALLSTPSAELASSLSGIPSVSMVVVHLGFRSRDAAGLTGLGFLVPRRESDSVLGVLLPSNIFQGRAPEGGLLATVMMGGARDPGAIQASDQALVDQTGSALRSLAGVHAAPHFALAIRHERAIPQYVIGHGARLVAIEALLRHHPGLFVAGNSYRGIAISACIVDASSVAARVAAYVG